MGTIKVTIMYVENRSENELIEIPNLKTLFTNQCHN